MASIRTATARINAAYALENLVAMIRRAGHTAPSSEDLHDWAHDIDWSDYTADNFDGMPFAQSLLATVEATEMSAADVVFEIEYRLGW